MFFNNEQNLKELEEKLNEAIPEGLANLSENELQEVLIKAHKDLGMSCPWGDQSFDDFMNDPDAVLDFS